MNRSIPSHPCVRGGLKQNENLIEEFFSESLPVSVLYKVGTIFCNFFCRLLFVRNFDESCCLSPLSRLDSWFLFFAGLQISVLLGSAWWMLFCHSAPHSISHSSLNDEDLLHLDENHGLPSFVLQQRSIANSVSPWKRRKRGWSLLPSCSYPPPIRNLL